MLRDRTQGLLRFACLTLIALALVPLLASAHVHRNAEAASPCGACFVAHHTAVKPTAPAVLLGAPAARPAAAPEITRPSLVALRSTHGVRAPPSTATHLV